MSAINECEMYADDSKVMADNELQIMAENGLQEDINYIVKWCETWSMSLNASKCKVMYFGKNNPHREYYIEGDDGNITLETTDVEKDSGVMVSNNGKWAEQVETAVKKASWVLGRIRKSFRFFDIELCKKLYPIFVRPHLEFASAVWNNLSVAEIKKIEAVQHRATGMVIELRGMSYYQRLEKLGFTDLDSRRRRGDLIQLFKVIKGFEEVDIGIKRRENEGRKHTHQIVRELCKDCNTRNRFLTNRIATTWNNLPAKVVGANSVNSFKAGLDKHMAAGLMRRSIYKV